jgi:hypothetical protein
MFHSGRKRSELHDTKFVQKILHGAFDDGEIWDKLWSVLKKLYIFKVFGTNQNNSMFI